MNPPNGNIPRAHILHPHQIQNLGQQRRGRPPNPVNHGNLRFQPNPVPQPQGIVMPAPILLQNQRLNLGIRLLPQIGANQAPLVAAHPGQAIAPNPAPVFAGNVPAVLQNPVAVMARNVVPVIAINAIPVIAGNAAPVVPGNLGPGAAGIPAPGMVANPANSRLFSNKIRTDFVEKFIASNQNSRQTIRDVKNQESRTIKLN
jgi:hypothetical protein